MTKAKHDEKPAETLEGGSYEVLLRRLKEAATGLGERAEALNRRRIETFGGTPLEVIANERVRTDNNCIPRDLVSLGDVLVFAYNVFLGLKTETTLGDVFALHRLGEGPSLEGLGPEAIPGLFDDPRFLSDFNELHRFYQGARLVRVTVQQGRLLAMFQTGQRLTDVRGFRWGLSAGGGVAYIDNRAEEDYQFPPSHPFSFTKTTREDQRRGRHPHVNILDTVFVETVGGDLTVKVEDNTEDGLGIYQEPVDDPRQSLDDAEYAYAKVGALILLEILPFQEKQRRYLIYNTRTRDVRRVDAVGQACLLLPEDHGIVFPGGYYLETGELKVFDTEIDDLVFERVVRAPNGEDVLYVFYHQEDGRYLLLPYNLIRKEVAAPLEGHGFTLFPDGKLLLTRQPRGEPSRVHPVQIWQTPFMSEEHAASLPTGGGFLERIGNAELVRGISDGLEIVRLANTPAPSRRTFEDLIGAASRAVGTYHWLASEEAGALAEPILAVRRATELVIDEFEKVLSLRARAGQALAEAKKEQGRLLREHRPSEWQQLEPFLLAMSELRRWRGHLITLRDVRLIDRPALDELEAEVVQASAHVNDGCVFFLGTGAALAPVAEAAQRLLGEASRVEKSPELLPLTAEAERLAEGLGLLSEVVAGLEVEDPSERTGLLESISEVYAALNRARATLEQRRRTLTSAEARSEFAAQFRLLGQSVESAVALADTPEACDEQLGRLLGQLEDLEARFAGVDELLADLTTKREEIGEAFGARKQQLLDERQRRSAHLFEAGARILDGAERRSRSFADEDGLNAYFASDPMILRLSGIRERLLELDDGVKAEDLGARLLTAKQTALRNLRDKRDLFDGDSALIRLGRHRFRVHTQPFDLTMVPRGDGLALHVAGTDFFEAVDDPELLSLSAFFAEPLVSESKEVYRGEYLAFSVREAAERGDIDREVLGARGAPLAAAVRRFAQDRYDEGYERGVHDHDAAQILEKLLVLSSSAGRLRHPPTARAAALLWWAKPGDDEAKARLHRRAESLGRLKTFFGQSADDGLEGDLAAAMADFVAPFGASVRTCARYLAEELAVAHPHFVESEAAEKLRAGLLERLHHDGSWRALEADLSALQDDPAAAFRLAFAWVKAYEAELGLAFGPVAEEAAAGLVLAGRIDRETSSALIEARVEGLLGLHPRIDGGLNLSIDEFEERLHRFHAERVPGFRRFQHARHRVLEAAKARLRLSEAVPQVLSSFVRNRLIDEVYLPLIGDNLAKQLGAAGDAKRTDLMGLLLVVSPPGYGKTTLMEYVAARLGMVFMKVNGPALGHGVRSLDPAEAPNATSRQEVEKMNLAFEMGNNVMLYLDDIQHTNPELLQKFISLCDGQRRVEGVWKGRTKTYDLRGKKFCVVMAGNPYTETGDKFQIPDMLANRADTYNLGDVLAGREEVFALSYLENALTSSPVLGPMAARSLPDLHRFIERARGREVADSDFEQDWSSVEAEEAVQTLRRLTKVQAVLLEVNQQYIASASQDDRFRTEPPFKLQGSYRNMNKLTEKVVPAMNDAELESLIDDHYRGESQTLTSGAEANLLKLAELRGRMSEAESSRWSEMKREFRRLQVAGGADDDPAARIASILAGVTEHLSDIGAAAKKATNGASDHQHGAVLLALERLEQALGRLSEPKLSVSVTSEPPLGLDDALAAPLARLESALGPLARAAATSHDEARRLWPALGELLDLLRVHALAGPVSPLFPLEPAPENR